MTRARLQVPSCRSDCNQGRRPCSAPQACLLPEDDEPDNLRPARGVVAALLITAALATMVIVLTWSAR